MQISVSDPSEKVSLDGFWQRVYLMKLPPLVLKSSLKTMPKPLARLHIVHIDITFLLTNEKMKNIISPRGAPAIGPTEADNILPTGVTPVTYEQ